MKYQKTFVTVNFIMGESQGIARYVVTPELGGEGGESLVSWQIKLYSISPPRSREWCPPSDWWGMANLRKEQVLSTFLHTFGKKELTINTSNC